MGSNLLPGYDSELEMYQDTHATIGLILADHELLGRTAEETLQKILNAHNQFSQATQD